MSTEDDDVRDEVGVTRGGSTEVVEEERIPINITNVTNELNLSFLHSLAVFTM